jgi:hypothetical protein
MNDGMEGKLLGEHIGQLDCLNHQHKRRALVVDSKYLYVSSFLLHFFFYFLFKSLCDPPVQPPNQKTRLFAGKDVFWAYVHRNVFLCFHTRIILCKTLDHLLSTAVKCGPLF